MKKKSSSRSAFFNLRVLIGLLIITTGLSLALFAANPFGRGASGTVSKAQQKYSPLTSSIDLSILPPGFDCSQVYALGIDRQENFRAGLIMKACGLEGDSAPAGGISGSSAFSRLIQKLLQGHSFIGGSDVDVILPDGSFPKVTQSESMEWGGPNNTWVVNYNDSRTASSCYSGLSYSTDNGATWHASQPLCSGHGTNFGDPIVVYNARLGMWFAGDLATGCGGQGIGLWTSANGVTWSTGACAHNGGSDDRESMWVDNNPASPFYGRMYISYNDFAINSGALYVTYSDNGTTWTAVQLNPGFIGDVYYIRSTDAGLTWGTPVKLNTDTGTAMQWQPSLTATQGGMLFASWYDGREANGGSDLNCAVGSPNPCYRRWGRVSFDNGATWQPNDMVGRALSGLPAQPDGAVQATYEGDYDYHSANGTTAIGGWTDGRVVISGNAQQDVFVNFVSLSQGTPTPTPTATVPPSPTPTATAVATPTATPTGIVLTASGRKVHGFDTVDLSWSGATSANVDIYRNGVIIATVTSTPGSYTDNTGQKGRATFIYKVCEAGTQNCSNQVTVTFGGG